MEFKMNVETKLYVKKLFENELVAICKNKVTFTLNIPAYVGMCIVELSKVLMYEFHYDCSKSKYCKNWNLFSPDTDSLMYEIKTKDV